jgi:hypothetical protein
VGTDSSVSLHMFALSLYVTDVLPRSIISVVVQPVGIIKLLLLMANMILSLGHYICLQATSVTLAYFEYEFRYSCEINCPAWLDLSMLCVLDDCEGINGAISYCLVD